MLAKQRNDICQAFGSQAIVCGSSALGADSNANVSDCSTAPVSPIAPMKSLAYQVVTSSISLLMRHDNRPRTGSTCLSSLEELGADGSASWEHVDESGSQECF